MNDQPTIYNSRIIKIYLEYLKRHYPQVDVDAILRTAGIGKPAVEDPAHWFSQDQADRFYEAVKASTGRPDVARDAGRFAASSEALGAGKQITLGLVNLSSAYLLMGKLYPIMSRGAAVAARKLGPNKVEILSIPNPGVKEKAYQCENRIGTFEAVARFFTRDFATVEHPECYHRGDKACRYVISWKKTPSILWRLIRNYIVVLGSLAALALFFQLAPGPWAVFCMTSAGAALAASQVALVLERRELTRTIEIQGDAAKDHMAEMNMRYNHALLVQEIGNAISKILNIDQLLREIVAIMERRLDFDRGMIMLVSKDGTRLVHAAGYGYDSDEERTLRGHAFHLDKAESQGTLVRAFREQRPFLINDLQVAAETFSPRSRDLTQQLGVNSMICVPVIYERNSLGVLAVDNVASKRLLTQSDVNLLMGVASQLSVSINNAISFQKLEDAAEKYRTILASIEEGYFELDLKGCLTFFNDSVTRLVGLRRDRLLGAHVRHFSRRANYRQVYRTFRNILETGRPARIIDYEFVRNDGRVRTLELSASLIRDAESQPLGFRGVVRDVTEKKEAEAMKQARIAAETASRAKSQFLANMSHEIRTPLNGIIGMTELLSELPLQAEQQDILEAIRTESNSLLTIINDILDFSKIEAGMIFLEEIPFNQNDFFDDLERAFGLKAHSKGLRLSFSISPEIPVRLTGDPARLRQIFNNLIDNAIKFTPAGAIEVSGRLEDTLGERLQLYFEIRDSGIGIPPEKLEAIFESFTQADSSTTRKYGGTGLGTTISQQLVTLMGGQIGAKSAMGNGSTFWFRINLGKAEAAPEARESDIAMQSLRVLVVDDKWTNRLILKEYLRGLGCQIGEASSARSALAILKTGEQAGMPFGLVITDLHMPEMSGFDLTSEMRRTGSLVKTPVIVVTSGDHPEDREICNELGISGYLIKPVGREELHKGIMKALRGTQTAKDISAAGMMALDATADNAVAAKHILLVEDYPTNQMVTMRHLRGAGYTVDLASNGQEAVEAVGSQSYDLVLMDIQMPIMDGYEATRSIREMERRVLQDGDMVTAQQQVRSLPIIAMTAHAFTGYRRKCLAMGMNDYLSKPFTKQALLDTVGKWLRGPLPALAGLENRRVPSSSGGVGEDPLDFPRALREFEGDGEFLLGVLAEFCETAAQQIGTLDRVILGGDYEAAAREVHSLKGGAGNLCATRLSGLARELERALKTGDAAASAVLLLTELRTEFEHLRVFVDELRARQRSQSRE